MLRNAVGGCQISRERRYEGARFNVIVINVKRGWEGVNFPEKKHYVAID